MITLPRKIVLCGVSKSGKSTLGSFLGKNYGHQSIAFADPMKEACKAIFGFSDQHLYGPSEEREAAYQKFEFSGWCFECSHQCRALREDEKMEPHHHWYCSGCGSTFGKYVTVREALKTLGTAWGRKFCHDIWSISCFANMKPDQSYVVTDCRFDNERHQSWRNGAITVLLMRGLEESTNPHPSEADVRTMARQPNLFHLRLDNREGTALENASRLLDMLQGYGRGEDRFVDPVKRQIAWKDYPNVYERGGYG